jgi:hypothetical protein
MLKFIRICYIVFACLLGMTPSLSFAFVSITIAPPALVSYDQPPCPQDGYLWTPGYWASADDGYYWVPGAWVEPPEVSYLWTPGYWGYGSNAYFWHAGYWGPQVGFYGGINYGYGYGGSGFYGGRWQGNAFQYNTAVWRVNPEAVHNTYVDQSVVNSGPIGSNGASYNGPGGIQARPTAEQQAATNGQHVQATSAQLQHEQTALHDPNQHLATNHGHPPTTALSSIDGHQNGALKASQVTSGQQGHGTVDAKAHQTSIQENSATKSSTVAKAKGATPQASGAAGQSKNPQIPIHEKPATKSSEVVKANGPAHQGKAMSTQVRLQAPQQRVQRQQVQHQPAQHQQVQHQQAHQQPQRQHAEQQKAPKGKKE